MISFSEIETTVKRATRSVGFSWGIAEEVGKNIRLLEMFGLPGIKNINQYFKIYNNENFENINVYARVNISKKFFCPIISGVNFFDQSSTISEFKQIEINNLAFPLLFIPFVIEYPLCAPINVLSYEVEVEENPRPADIPINVLKFPEIVADE